MNSIQPLIFCAFLLQIFFMRMKNVEGSPRRIVGEIAHLETFKNHKNYNPDMGVLPFSLKSDNAETDEENESQNENGNGNDNKDNKNKKDKSRIDEEDVINFPDPESIDASSMGDSNSSSGDKNDWSKRRNGNSSSNSNNYSKNKSKSKKNSQEEEDIMKDFHKSKTTAKPHAINSHGKGNNNHKKTSHSSTTKNKQTETQQQQDQQGQEEDLKSIMDKAIEKATSISENIGDAIKAAMNNVATALKNATEVSEIVASVPCNSTSNGSISTTPLNLKVNRENCTSLEEQSDSKKNSNTGPISSISNSSKKQWRYSEVAKWPPVLPFGQTPPDTRILFSSSNTGNTKTATTTTTGSKKKDQSMSEIPEEFSGVLTKGKVGIDGATESDDSDGDDNSSMINNSGVKSGSGRKSNTTDIQHQVQDPDESEEDAEAIMVNSTNFDMTSSSDQPKSMPLTGAKGKSVLSDHNSSEEDEETGSGESPTRNTSGTKTWTSSKETMDDDFTKNGSGTKVTQLQNQTSSSGPAPKSSVQRDVALTISGGGGMFTSGTLNPSGSLGSTSVISASTNSGNYSPDRPSSSSSLASSSLSSPSSSSFPDYPVINKPGNCRSLTTEVACIALSPGSSQCQTDNGCSGTKKCCFYRCAPYNSVGICEFPTMHI